MSNGPELGLETLLAVRAELGAEIDADLVKACFEIQKKYQFDHDRTSSTQAIDRLIDGYVTQAAEKTPETEG